MTHIFEIRPEPLVLSFGKLSQDGLAPLGIEENHVRAVDLLVLFYRRIGTRNVESPTLHEVEISIATAGFSPACKTHVAVRHQSNALVIRWPFGLDLFDALFKITGKLKPRFSKTQPHDDERKQNPRDMYDKTSFDADVKQTMHAARIPPTDSFTTCSKYGFLRASMLLDVATKPQVAGLFAVANSRHDWAQIVGEKLIGSYKGCWSWTRQKLL